jgi:hypothetical protein
MNIAQKMRDLALKNKDVRQAYQKALADIKESAENGDLSVEIYKDETVLFLLVKDGFTIEGTCLVDKVIIRW